MRIMIVDDSPLVWRSLFERMTELPRVSVLAYVNRLAEARRCLAALQPELLILETLLPDGNGFDLLREIRTGRAGVKIAVFCNQPELRRYSLRLGADWFFDKSLDFLQLIALVKDQHHWRRPRPEMGD